MTVFDHYASYYDLFYEQKDYRAEAAYVCRHLRQHAPAARCVFELGCGTGGHAAGLVDGGYRITGVDLSDVMLARAERRRSSWSPDRQAVVRFIKGDARTVRVGEAFDAIVSLFHVVSYQTSNADLEAMFRTAADHLAPDGVFAFDFWYGPAVLSERPETRARNMENEHVRVTRIARSRLRENENLVDVNFEVLVEEKSGGRLQRIEELHVMRYLFLPEIDAVLERVGMHRLCAKKWLTDEEPSVGSWSGFVVAAKTRT